MVGLLSHHDVFDRFQILVDFPFFLSKEGHVCQIQYYSVVVPYKSCELCLKVDTKGRCTEIPCDEMRTMYIEFFRIEWHAL